MIILAILGWLVVLAIGAWIASAGVYANLLSLAFSGTIAWQFVLMAMLGMAIIAAGIWFTPFSVSFHLKLSL